MSSGLSHISREGVAQMVNVGDKPVSQRIAMAKGEICMKLDTFTNIIQGNIIKGDVVSVAQLAGVMAAKKTDELIPLCHRIPIDQVVVEVVPNPQLPGFEIIARVRASARTGVEMEALTAVAVTALTIYDMAKALEKTMRIQNIRLVEKSGGQSGEIHNE
jgi:cyclic pyranopterin phosphate synthase